MIDVRLTFNVQAVENALRRAVDKAVAKKKKEIFADMRQQIKDAFRYAVNTIVVREVAKYAPSIAEERRALSRGRTSGGRVVGESDGSRLIKTSPFKYLQQAILDDARFSVLTSQSASRFNLTFYLTEQSQRMINNEIGFAWMKKRGRRGLEKRSTMDAGAYQPTWGFLLQRWEYGGGPFTVRPRDEKGLLYPGPGRRGYKAITKWTTVKPYRMFERGMKSSYKKIMSIVKQRLKTRYSK